MSIVYGLLCAIFYGVADYAGGRASRRASSTAVTASSQAVGFVLIVLLLPFLGGDGPTPRALIVGALGGLCGASGLLLLYRGLSLASMSVVSPVTAVLSAVVPVIAGLIIGEGLTAVRAIGIALAIAAVALISRGGDLDEATTGDAPPRRPSTSVLLSIIIAGVFFGLFVVALDRAGDNVGVWPLIAAKPVGVLFAIGVATSQRVSPIAPRSVLPFTFLAGANDMAANVFALLAAQAGQVAIAGVLVSLYPASTVFLARVVDRERLERLQIIGFVVAVIGLILIAV